MMNEDRFNFQTVDLTLRTFVVTTDLTMLFSKAVIPIIWISSTIECKQLQPTSPIEHELLTDISYIDIAQHVFTMPLDNVPLNNKPNRHHFTEGHRNSSGSQTETPLKSAKEKPHLLLLVYIIF